MGDLPITVKEVSGYFLIILGRAKIKCLSPFKGISALAVVTILEENGFFILDGRKVLISMNEPLRHREYTFYQASFIEDGLTQTSVLATVKNYGRLFPYISTIIMCIGLLYHMLFILSRRFKSVRKFWPHLFLKG